MNDGTSGSAATGARPATGMRPGDTVRTEVPATTAFVALLRTIAASVATRLDMDLDHVEDIRLAVSEACAVLLPVAEPGSVLTMDVQVQQDGLGATLSVATAAAADAPGAPGEDSFAWTVLRALADEASTEAGDGVVSIRLGFRDDQMPASGWPTGSDLP